MQGATTDQADKSLSSSKMEVTTTSQADKTPPPECHFFKIPPELRLIIYEDVLSDFTFDPNAEKPKDSTVHSPLLDTCTLIREEAYKLYLKRLQALRQNMRKQATLLQTELKTLSKRRKEGGMSDLQQLDLLQQALEVLEELRSHSSLVRKHFEFEREEIIIWGKLGC